MQGRALVTGAGTRLGQCMAVYLASRGYDVAVHYSQSSAGAQDTVSQIQALGRQAVAFQADLLDLDATEGLIERAAEGLGGALSVLVNSASIFEYDTLQSASRESWDRHMMSNLRAPFILSQSFASQVTISARRSNALIVNMVDQRVRKLSPEYMTYSLAKHALWTLTRTSAQALAPAIRVNAIGPGSTLKGALESKELFDKKRRNTLLGIGAEPQDILAALGYFLDSPAVTGQLLCVDGGQHLT